MFLGDKATSCSCAAVILWLPLETAVIPTASQLAAFPEPQYRSRRLPPGAAASSPPAATFFPRLGLVDRQRTAVVVLAVEPLDGRLGLLVVPHLHKPEAFAAARDPVQHDVGRRDQHDLASGRAEGVFSRVNRRFPNARFALLDLISIFSIRLGRHLAHPHVVGGSGLGRQDEAERHLRDAEEEHIAALVERHVQFVVAELGAAVDVFCQELHAIDEHGQTIVAAQFKVQVAVGRRVENRAAYTAWCST